MCSEDFSLLRQLDPARDSETVDALSYIMAVYDVEDPRLRLSHDRISVKFSNGVHGNTPVEDLVDGLLSKRVDLTL